MRPPSVRELVASLLTVTAASALAVSLGLHPILVTELGLVVVVLLLARELLRLAPTPRRPPAVRTRSGHGDERRARAHRTVTVTLTAGSGIDTHLRSAVREIVVARLALRGLTLPRDNEAVRELVPPRVAEVLRRGTRRHGEPGLTRQQLHALLDDLEDLW